MTPETPIPEPKPGYLTSEFWMGMIAQVLVWYEAINPSFHVTPSQQTKLTLAAGALSLVATAFYSYSRKGVKVAHQQAVAAVVTAVASAPATTYAPVAPVAVEVPVLPYGAAEAERRAVAKAAPQVTARPRSRPRVTAKR